MEDSTAWVRDQLHLSARACLAGPMGDRSVALIGIDAPNHNPGNASMQPLRRVFQLFTQTGKGRRASCF
jgi:hypothetical protein